LHSRGGAVRDAGWGERLGDAKRARRCLSSCSWGLLQRRVLRHLRPRLRTSRYFGEATVGVVPLQWLGQLSALVSRGDSIGESSTPPVRMVETALAASPKVSAMDAEPSASGGSWTRQVRDRRSHRQSPRLSPHWNCCCHFERRSAERLRQRNSCRPWEPS
jgi:hypothetical protein